MSTLAKALAAMLAALGVSTVATGLYFVLLRPPLLPEDVRFMELAETEIPAAIRPWLSIVFRTWGGFMVGLGLCVLGRAMGLASGRDRWSRIGMAAGLVLAFGSFLASNVQLRSDFLWFIALLFVVATACALLLVTTRGDP
ncbi:MAG: hypothetical protein JWN48_5621 [Myxococcaceae bacterium]|nr:hypothetical protein [Myxococcaceae bacterium]